MTDPGSEGRLLELHDGTTLVVRPARPDDVEGLGALFEGLGLEDRNRRFFSAFRPGRAFLDRLAANTGDDGLQLVAVERGADAGERLVAEAGYRLLANGDGELAITVSREWRGWLGPYLLDALIEGARARGVANLEADVLVTNATMLALLHARGYAVMERDDPTVLRVVIGTGGPSPGWPPDDDRPRVLVESPGGRWHAGAAGRAAGLQVVACPGPTSRRGPCPLLAGGRCLLAEGADTIVVSRPPDDPDWDALPDAHRRHHAGVPVCIEPFAARSAADHRTTDDAPEVLELVQRLATDHAHDAR